MNDSAWTPLGSSERLFTARYEFPGGRSRTTLVALPGNRWIAYSPGRDLAASAGQLMDAGAELFLVAPASSHLMGLDAWRAQFEHSTIIACEASKARIVKKTKQRDVQPLRFLQAMLPETVNAHAVAGSALGEIWLRVDEPKNVFWLVCDVFMNIDKFPDAWFIRTLMRLYGLRTGLDVSRGFSRRGIDDKRTFRDWALALFAEDRGHVLVPCHGLIDDGPMLGERLRSVITKRFA